MNLSFSLFCGLAASFLMYESVKELKNAQINENSSDSGNTENLKNQKIGRNAGIFAAPLAALLSCTGFYSIITVTEKQFSDYAFAAFIILCFGAVFEGFYFANRARIAEMTDEKSFNSSMYFFRIFRIASLLLLTAGLVILFIITFMGHTAYPKWTAVINPIITLFIYFLISRFSESVKNNFSLDKNTLAFMLYFVICFLYSFTI